MSNLTNMLLVRALLGVISLLLLFAINGIEGAAANLPLSEITALHALYNSTQGWDWLWRPVKPRWTFTPTANPCTAGWQGIKCTLPSPFTVYYVSEISLRLYRLTGPLPASIGYFTHLTKLDLSHNHINESIPSTVGQLTRLASLSIGFNQFTGGLTDALCELTQMSHLEVQVTDLGGPIPPCLGRMVLLNNLTLADNKFTGRIPASLGNLSSLTIALLQRNHLTGPIPSSLTTLSTMKRLDLQDNILTGPIPDIFSALASLEVLMLNSNLLNGSLPTSLGTVPGLTKLDVSNNRITGTIPASYANLQMLEDLDLGLNHLSGALPEFLGDLSRLEDLYLDNNPFSGTIPPSITKLRNLQNLILYQTTLSGSIPSSLGNLTALEVLELNDNHLTGPVPESIGALTSMEKLYLSWSQFSGTLPSSFGNLVNCDYFSLNNNHFSGSMPATLGKLASAITLYLNGNHFSGWLPETLGSMSSMAYLYLGANHFSGRLPRSLGKLQTLVECDMSTNLLSGDIPRTLGTIPGLSVLSLGSNILSGNLDALFNSTAQPNLVTLKLDVNQLTGTLPGEAFKIPALLIFVAVTNCFHGSIPIEVCNASSLNSLILDGMSSATSCRRTLPSGAYLLSRSVGGTLPPCLFQSRTLATVHLSGNSFTGTLPPLGKISEKLSDLAVSHNELTGPVPSEYQQRRWSNFDVSYNRLSGTLHADFATVGPVINDSTVSLENNRLSGRIPGYLQARKGVSMLGTNLFECNLAGSNLPQYDSQRSNYQCGSAGFDIPYYTWLCVTAPIALLLVWRWSHALNKDSMLITLTRLVTSWYASSQRALQGRPILPNLMHVLDTLCWTSAYCAVYVTVVLVPCYVLLSNYHGMLTHQYAWTVSAAYLTGTVPAAVELALWLLLLCVVIHVAHQALSKAEYFSLAANTPTASQKTVLGISIAVPNRAVIRALFVVINIVVVVGVNVLYVYIALYQSSALLVLAQVLMSFFKLLWSSTCMDAILRSLVKKLAPELVADSYAMAYRIEFLPLHMFVALINSIAIPCLVVAGISPDCFYNVFQPAPVVNSISMFPQCTSSVGSECVQYTYEGEYTTFSTPYIYNYQCSSSLITYYAPAYINLCIVATVVSPAAHILCGYLQQRAVPGTIVHMVLDKMLPRIFKPAPAADAPDNYLTYLKADQQVITLVTYLGVLLTFGAMIPPLGVALAATIALVVVFLKIKLGRFLCSAEEQGQLAKYVRILEEQCEGAGSPRFLQRTLWMLLILSCLFYTLFLFDTLGDAVGFRGAVWVLVVVPLMPLWFFIGYNALTFARRLSADKARAETAARETVVEVELGEVCAKYAGEIAAENETHNVLFAQ